MIETLLFDEGRGIKFSLCGWRLTVMRDVFAYNKNVVTSLQTPMDVINVVTLFSLLLP